MAVNEKQIGIRLKDPALQVIERRTERINDLAPEVKTTTGTVAKHAVEEYARKLDRRPVETHLVMPFIDWHSQIEFQQGDVTLDDHPFIEEKDLKMNYDLDDLGQLCEHFNGITEIMKRYDYLTKSELQAWIGITSSLSNTYNQWKSGIEYAEEQEQLKLAQEQWAQEQDQLDLD